MLLTLSIEYVQAVKVMLTQLRQDIQTDWLSAMNVFPD